MGCLNWPQKKALKIAFKLIERQLDDGNNNQQNVQNGQYMPNQNQQNQQSNSAQNIKLAMNLVGKVLQL